jgi:hypothetical protein
VPGIAPGKREHRACQHAGKKQKSEVEVQFFAALNDVAYAGHVVRGYRHGMFRRSEVWSVYAFKVSGGVLGEPGRGCGIASQEQIDAVVHVVCLSDKDSIGGEYGEK